MFNNNLRPPRRKKEIQSLDFLILFHQGKRMAKDKSKSELGFFLMVMFYEC